MTFEEIYRKREKLHIAIKENRTGVLRIVTELYSDNTHFIYEILQNAEDAKATKITFTLCNDSLIINHNGLEFSLKDIEGITNIAGEDNDKKTDEEKIGRFGIGFKSVYAITNEPHIQSGKYDFKIKEFLLPELVSDNNNFKDTCIILPFYNNKKSNNEIFDSLRKKLEALEHFNLLFLNNLEKIEIKVGETKREIIKIESGLPVKGSKIAFKSLIKANEATHHYLLFKKDVKHTAFSLIKNRPKVSIAFKQETNEGRTQIVRSDSSKLFVFFETGFETFLKFMINAPFVTTPARDNVNFQESINLDLLEELNDLMKEALEYLSINKLISINFLNLLPISSGLSRKEIVYYKFFDSIKNEFLSGKKYLPVSENNMYAPASSVGLIRGKELKQILSSKTDLRELFKIDYWLSSEITQDKTPDLRFYLMRELSIREYGPDDFARVVSKEFLESKSNTWIRSLYGFLNGKQQSLYTIGRGRDEGILRKKAIIRLSNGKHTEPFDLNGKPKVFLPTGKKKNQYDTIHPDVISNKPSLEFIKDKLGIKEPDLIDQLRQSIIPLYKTGEKKFPNVNDHLEHMQLILNVYSKSKETIRTEIVEMLTNKDIFFFYVYDLKTSQTYWGRPSECYLENDKLLKYFRFSDKIYFLKDSFYAKKISNELLHELALKCGIKNYPRLVQIDTQFSSEHKRQLRIEAYRTDEITWSHGEKIFDYSLAGFKDIIQQKSISKDDSILLWDTILEFIKQDSSRETLFKGRYWWFRSYERNAYFPSHILLMMRNTDWLYTIDGECLKPSEVTISRLAREYNTNTDQAIILINKLKFKTEAEVEFLNQMPVEKRNEFLEAAELIRLSKQSGIDIKSLLQNKIEESRRSEYERELQNAPEVLSVTIEEEPFIGYDDSNVDVRVTGEESKEVDSQIDKSGESDNDDSPMSDRTTPPEIPKDIKDKIGYRGERVAWQRIKQIWSEKYNLLCESEFEMEFENPNGDNFNIIHLNESGKKGIGCDILIKEGENIIEYVEVKSTKLETKDLFPVNGYQWSLAQKVFKEGEGNKYYFYVVKDVLSTTPKVTRIKNPIKKWKDGELRAHPVNIEL